MKNETGKEIILDKRRKNQANLDKYHNPGKISKTHKPVKPWIQVQSRVILLTYLKILILKTCQSKRIDNQKNMN